MHFMTKARNVRAFYLMVHNDLIFTIIVYGAPYFSQGPHSACNFAKAAVKKGHTIKSVFFLYNGALNACAAVTAPPANTALLQQWQEFKATSATELLVCVSSAKKSGLANAQDSTLPSDNVTNLAPEFEIAGLGALTESIVLSDRVITFGSSP